MQIQEADLGRAEALFHATAHQQCDIMMGGAAEDQDRKRTNDCIGEEPDGDDGREQEANLGRAKALP